MTWINRPASPLLLTLWSKKVRFLSRMPEQEPDQQLSDEENYQETVRGVRSFMGWHQVPGFQCSASSQDNNQFAGPRIHSTGNILVKLSSDDWLCRKMEKLNLPLTEDYPTHSSDASGLSRDQFVKVPHTQKWYDVYAQKKGISQSKVYCWPNEPVKLNNSFTRVARPSISGSPASRPIAQETLR